MLLSTLACLFINILLVFCFGHPSSCSLALVQRREFFVLSGNGSRHVIREITKSSFQSQLHFISFDPARPPAPPKKSPKATFWAGQDSSCPDPCTKCSARAHSTYRPIPDHMRFIMGQESPFSIHPVIPSMTQPTTQRTFLSPLSIAPRKRLSTLIWYVSETNGSRTRTSREHATTYSTKPSTTHSSSPLIPTSRDGIHRWKSSTSWSK